MFDGVGSPCTQTFCLGLFQQPDGEELDRLEEFFTGRGSVVHHEVSPLAGVGVAQMLNDRGYRPIEMSQVMFLPVAARPFPAESAIQVRMTRSDESELWARTAADGWRDVGGASDIIFELMRIIAAREDAPCFLAELDGTPIGAAACVVHDGVALLAGASTIPEWRNRGCQRALFTARLEYAALSACDVAMVVAEPGSASQRNAERQGFRISYTRTKWELSGR